jgi:hypothetical protein
VRVVCDCPGAQAGDEAKVVAVQCADLESEEVLTILIDHDPATTHGTVVYAHEVELVPPES